jgi:hypothetical protein
MKKPIISTILCAFVIMFAAPQIVKAASDSVAFGWSETFKSWGKWEFVTENGVEWTYWRGEDGSFGKRKGHERYATDPSEQNPPIEIIIRPGNGELLLETNRLVSSQIINNLTGQVVGTTITNGNGSIPTGTLEAGKPYTILSTDGIGAPASSTFLLNNNNQIYLVK